MKILAIGAHPDDIEIFMYGLLTIFKERGDEIITIIVTDDSKGGRQKGDILKKKRKKEALLGLKKLASPIFLDIPDGELGDDPEHKKLIKQTILKVMPDLVITHSEFDYHSDHRILGKFTKDTVSHYLPILYCDTLMGINFNPNYYIDITKHFEMKIEAILCHKSQDPQRFVDLIKLMNSYRAAQCNSPKDYYSEGYYFIPSFPFSDIRYILPPSSELRPFHIEKRKGFL